MTESEQQLTLPLRTRRLAMDRHGRRSWETVETVETWSCRSIALALTAAGLRAQPADL